VLSNHGLLE